MPDDFPSNDADNFQPGRGPGGSAGQGPQAPGVTEPTSNPDSAEGENGGLTGSPGGSAGTGNGSPNPSTPPSGGSGSDLPDAGADGGTVSPEGETEGETAQ